MSDGLRDELADVLEAPFGSGNRHWAEEAVDALLPVVRRYAARELREAAGDWPPTWAASPPDYLRERADAIEAGE
ncbi:MAG: hypothetical protein ACXVXJ_04705 [Mycobacteriaceae bacterium]